MVQIIQTFYLNIRSLILKNIIHIYGSMKFSIEYLRCRSRRISMRIKRKISLKKKKRNEQRWKIVYLICKSNYGMS